MPLKILQGSVLITFIFSLTLLSLRGIKEIAIPVRGSLLLLIAGFSLLMYIAFRFKRIFRGACRYPVGVLFLLTICIPSFFFLGGIGKSIVTTENRKLVEFPSFPNDLVALQSFPSVFDAAFSDNFPFRANIVGLKSRIMLDIFESSSNPDIVVGSRGWLFYKGNAMERSIEDYLGKTPLSARDLTMLVSYIVKVDKELRNLGIKFAFIITPDKQSVYSEYLPRALKEGFPHRIDQVMEGFENSDVVVIDIRQRLRDVKKKLEPLYYRNDTHWNVIGGGYAFSALMKALELPAPERNNYEIVSVDDGYSGDIVTSMLGMPEKKEDNYMLNAINVAGQRLTPVSPSTEEIRLGEKKFTNIHGNGLSVLLIHDSFADALFPYFSAVFSRVLGYRPGIAKQDLYVDIDRVRRESPDIVILQVVERSLPYLAVSVAKYN